MPTESIFTKRREFSDLLHMINYKETSRSIYKHTLVVHLICQESLHLEVCTLLMV